MPGRLSRLSTLERYLAALVCVGGAMALRWVLEPLLGTQARYLLQYVAILVSARYFGFGPAIAGLVLASTPVYYALYLRPRTDLRFWVALAVTYAFSVFLVWLLNRQRTMRAEVESTTRLARE